MSYDPGSHEDGRFSHQESAYNAYALPRTAPQHANSGSQAQPYLDPALQSQEERKPTVPQAPSQYMVNGLPVGAPNLDPKREIQKGRWAEEEEEELERFVPLYVAAGKSWDEIALALTKRRSSAAIKARFGKLAETKPHLSQYLKKRSKTAGTSSRGSTPGASSQPEIAVKEEPVEQKPQPASSIPIRAATQVQAGAAAFSGWTLDEDAALITAIILRGEVDMEAVRKEMQPTYRSAKEIEARWHSATKHLHTSMQQSLWHLPLPLILANVQKAGLDAAMFHGPAPPQQQSTRSLSATSAYSTGSSWPPQQQQLLQQQQQAQALRRTISADPNPRASYASHPYASTSNSFDQRASSLDQYSLSNGRGAAVGRPSPLGYSASPALSGFPQRGSQATSFASSSSYPAFPAPRQQFASPAPVGYARQTPSDTYQSLNAPLPAPCIPVQPPPNSVSTSSLPSKRSEQSPGPEQTPGGTRARSSRAASQRAGDLMNQLARDSERADEEDEQAIIETKAKKKQKQGRAGSDSSAVDTDEAKTPADGIAVRDVKIEDGESDTEVKEEEEEDEDEEFAPRKSKRMKKSATPKKQ